MTTIECIVCYHDLTNNSQVALGCCNARICRSCALNMNLCPQCRTDMPFVNPNMHSEIQNLKKERDKLFMNALSIRGHADKTIGMLLTEIKELRQRFDLPERVW